MGDIEYQTPSKAARATGRSLHAASLVLALMAVANLTGAFLLVPDRLPDGSANWGKLGWVYGGYLAAAATGLVGTVIAALGMAKGGASGLGVLALLLNVLLLLVFSPVAAVAYGVF